MSTDPDELDVTAAAEQMGDAVLEAEALEAELAGTVAAAAAAAAGPGREPAEPGGDLGAPSLAAALEALLLLADEPVPMVTLAEVVRRPMPEVEVAVRSLAAEYDRDGRGFELREVAGGWRYYTRAECAPVVERWVLDGQQARLTQAALETLAVVAYRQPVSRARIGAIRGVNVDSVVRTLLARGLITEVGHDPDTGATRYGTTALFLERLGLRSLDELPPLAEHLPDLADLDEILDAAAAGE